MNPTREWYSNVGSNDIFPRTLATLIGSRFNKILAREFSALSLDEIDEESFMYFAACDADESKPIY